MNKKFIAIILAVVFTASAQAQFTFGVRAGFNLTNMSIKEEGEKPDGDDAPKFKPGFQIGVVGDYAISENFSIQPGLLFATQGFRTKFEGEWMGVKYEYKGSINLNYIQLPINAQLKFGFENMKIIVQAGPYLGYAISGKWKSEMTIAGETEKEDGKIEIGTDEEKHEMKPFDFGIGLGAGLQFGNCQVGVGYNLGLTNILVGGDKDNFMKNNGLSLTLTYTFGGGNNNRR